MKRIGEWFLSGAMWLSMAAGADVKVLADVDPKPPLEMGESFTYSITVTSDSSHSVNEPRLPDLSGFDISNAFARTEARSTFSNGALQVEQSRTFNYSLTPKKTGVLHIGPAEVVVDGKAMQTKGIEITVKPSGMGGQAQRPRAQAPTEDEEDPFHDMEDVFNQLMQRRGLRGHGGGAPAEPREVNPNEAFFIDAEVDKPTAYAGEQITADWYLYTRGMIRDIDTLKYPSLTNFWKEEIELATRLNFENHIVNGVPYKRALLASYALFPIKEGTATVDAYKAKCTVLTGDAFGFGHPYVFTKQSKPIPIQVKPLPVEGRPKNFSGAVGDFEVSATLDRDTVPVNQPVTLKIHFAGMGNAKLIDLPPLNLPAGFEMYDTKKDAKFFRDGKSFKDFEVLLIPRQAGRMQVPAVGVSIFNPQTGKYQEHATQVLNLEVTPASGEPAVAAPMKDEPAPAVEKPKGPEMPGVIVDRNAGEGPMMPWWSWIAVYLAAAGAMTYHAVSMLGLGRSTEALKTRVNKRMKRLEELAKKGDARGVGVHSVNLIYMVLGELAGRGGADRHLEVLLSEGPPSLRRELGEPIKNVVAQSESLAFAPDELVAELGQKPNLKKFLGELEKTLLAAIALGHPTDEAKS